jgi:hypothetical protein
LTRGITLYFIPLLGVWFLAREYVDARVLSAQTVRAALAAWGLVAVAAVATLAPWAVRNFIVHRQFVLLETKGGVNLWLGNSPYTPNDFIRNVWKTGVREPMLAPLPTDEVARDRTAYALALDYIARNPMVFLARMPIKFADLWGFERNLVDLAEGTRESERYGWKSVPKIAMDALTSVAYIALMLAALYGLFAAPNDLGKWLVVLFGAYFVFVHLVVFGDARFHIPLVPLLAPYAGYALLARPRVSLKSARGWMFVVMLVVFVLVWAHEILAAATILWHF